jgi:hypothetical protein
MCAPLLQTGAADDRFRSGYHLLSQYAEPAPQTSLHERARESVWRHTQDVLQRVLSRRPTV